MSSAICFNLGRCKILSSGNGLKQYNVLELALSIPKMTETLLNISKIKALSERNGKWKPPGRRPCLKEVS